MKRNNLSGEQVLIYGAGRGGEILLREILYNRKLKIKPVGFVDDDTLKTGKKLQGYPVLGTCNDLETLVQNHQVTSLLISFINPDSQRLKSLRTFCRANDLGLKQFSVHIAPIDTEEP